MKLKRLLALSAAMLFCLTGCSLIDWFKAKPGGSDSSASEAEPEVIRLVNHMTREERRRTEVRALTLLDEPQETEHTVGIEWYTKEEYLAIIEAQKDRMSEEEYRAAVAEIESLTEFAAHGALIDGCAYYGMVPPRGYDGGRLSFAVVTGDPDPITGNVPSQEIELETAEDYFAYLEQSLKDSGTEENQIAEQLAETRLVFDAVIHSKYEELKSGSIHYDSLRFGSPLADYRDVWVFDRDAVSAVRDSVKEIAIYDEQLDTDFLVHVMLPPHFDPEKTYPVFLLTDGVWRFGNCPSLRKLMENGEAAEVILVSLGYSYRMDGTNESVRSYYMIGERSRLLDFVTDDLMPYLGTMYHIDYANSTLYGHSDGGVFAHYALFNSDQYDNQPFGRYIIGSPVMWALYNDYDNDFDTIKAIGGYGYFDRAAECSKQVFLCGGSLEDPDCEHLYNGHETTLECLAKIETVCKAHGVTYQYKLYESHHDRYIPEMLCECLKAFYPAEKT